MESNYTHGNPGMQDVRQVLNSRTGFNVRDPYVRHQSIGWLDESYVHRRHLNIPDHIESIRPYTRIAPLATYQEFFSSSKFHFKTLTKSALTAALFLLAILKKPYKAIEYKLPKTYSIDQGVRINAKAVSEVALKGLVVATIALLLTLSVTSLSPAHNKQTATNGGQASNSHGQNAPQPSSLHGTGHNTAGGSNISLTASQTSNSESPNCPEVSENSTTTAASPQNQSTAAPSSEQNPSSPSSSGNSSSYPSSPSTSSGPSSTSSISPTEPSLTSILPNIDSNLNVGGLSLSVN